MYPFGLSNSIQRHDLSIEDNITTRCTGLEQPSSLGRFRGYEKIFFVSVLPDAVPAGEQGVMSKKKIREHFA